MTEKVNFICYTLVISIVNIYNSDQSPIVSNTRNVTRAYLLADNIFSSSEALTKEKVPSKQTESKEFRLNLLVPSPLNKPKEINLCMEYSEKQEGGNKTIFFLIKQVAPIRKRNFENEPKVKNNIKQQDETLIKGELKIEAAGKGNLAENFDKNYSLVFFQRSKFFGKVYLKIEVSTFFFFLELKKGKQESQSKTPTIGYQIKVGNKEVLNNPDPLPKIRIEDYDIFNVEVIYKVSLYNEVPKEGEGENSENYIGFYSKSKSFGEIDEFRNQRDFQKFYSELRKSRLSFLRKWLNKIQGKKKALLEKKVYKDVKEGMRKAFLNCEYVEVSDNTLNSPFWESDFETRIFYFEQRVDFQAIFIEVGGKVFLLVVPKDLDVSDPNSKLSYFFANENYFEKEDKFSFHFLTEKGIVKLGYSCKENEKSSQTFYLSKTQEKTYFQNPVVPPNDQKTSSNERTISTQTESLESGSNLAKSMSGTEENTTESKPVEKMDRQIQTQESDFITTGESTASAKNTNTQRKDNVTTECSATTMEKTIEVAENQDLKNHPQNSNENTQTEGQDNLIKKIKSLKGYLLIVLGVVLVGISGSIYFIRRSKTGGDLEDSESSLRDGGRHLWDNVDG